MFPLACYDMFQGNTKRVLFPIYLLFTLFYIYLKVTVHVGTDQNIEIEIFAEYKYALNELLVTKIVFQ